MIQRSGFLTASIIFLFISFVWLVWWGFTAVVLASTITWGAMYEEKSGIIGGISAFLGAGFGLLSGILIVQQKKLFFALLGIVLTLIGALFLGLLSSTEDALEGFLFSGFPVIFFSCLAFIFTVIRRNDFQ